MPREVVGRMRTLGRALAEIVPEPYRFVMLTFVPGEEGYSAYISNAHRQEVIEHMKAFIRETEEGMS